MPAKLALMLEISRKQIYKKQLYTDGLNIFRSQELLPVSLETRVQYGGGEITRVRLNETRFGPKNSRPRYISALKKKVAPNISRPKKNSDSRTFMAVPVSIDGKSILTLYYSTLQNVHRSK